MSAGDPDALRARQLDSWARAATAWGRRAARIRDWGMPVSEAMIEGVAPQPGHRVLELAAGPGDTGFLAAELIRPGGTLISSDGTEEMVSVARARAAELGIDNVEFRQLELEWIDLPTAEADIALCRWGLMLTVDPAAAAAEMRRVLAPGGRLAVAVWAEREHNPWATIPTEALVGGGLIDPPATGAPGMFALSAPGALEELLGDAGFLEVAVSDVAVERTYREPRQYLEETGDLSMSYADALSGREEGREEVEKAIIRQLSAFTDAAGVVRLPGLSRVATASA